MLELGRIKLISGQRHIEQRCRCDLLTGNSVLMNVQSPRPNPKDTLAGPNANQLVALLIEVRQCAAQCGENVFDRKTLVIPLVHRRVFQVEHHARRARIEHLYNQFRVVGRPGHLVTLVLAPLGQLDSPPIAYRLARIAVGGFVPLQGLSKHPLALANQLFLPGRETLVQILEEVGKTARQIALYVEAARRSIQVEPTSDSTSLWAARNLLATILRSRFWCSSCSRSNGTFLSP